MRRMYVYEVFEKRLDVGKGGLIMSKSILVIETPKNCEECPFVRHCIDCITEDFCTLDESKRDIVNPEYKTRLVSVERYSRCTPC